MARKKKTDMDNQTANQAMPEVTTRDPAPENRDPVRRTCTPRLYIQANSPTVCPKCSGCTRMDNGRHVDPVRRKILISNLRQVRREAGGRTRYDGI